MTLRNLLASLLLLFTSQLFGQYPEATIANGTVAAKLYLPDPVNGYYRATRFDWAGVIFSATYNGHEYFGKWYAADHNPRHHDAIQGPVEAFDPIGYDTAAPGEAFLKIGVGLLKKINNNPYRFNTPFELVNGGKWHVKKKKDRIEFTQKLDDPTGYSYIYTKTVRLTKDKPGLVLEHRLKNTGTRPLETNVLNHNFFMIDQQPTGPDFTVSVGFDIANAPNGKELIGFEKNQIRYTRELKKGDSTMEYPTGYVGGRQEEYDFTIRNAKTGAAVRITADRPLERFMYWSVPTTLSPEPFIRVSALPGRQFDWAISYEFISEK